MKNRIHCDCAEGWGLLFNILYRNTADQGKPFALHVLGLCRGLRALYQMAVMHAGIRAATNSWQEKECGSSAACARKAEGTTGAAFIM
jgi:hypothetical protein